MPSEVPTLDVLFFRFGMSLFLGFLIGLEREREKTMVFAGMRTFALISLLGASLAFLSEQFAGSWLFVVGFLTVSGFGLVSYFQGFKVGHTGITTEVVFMLSFVLGALVYWDWLELAAAITVVVVLVLTFKPNLQTFAAKIDRDDIWAGLEFAIVWIIVLPLLPDRTYGPLDVLNPREIWLMVVLVSAINLGSYVLAQIYGAHRGIGLTGLLGGLISSTVVTYDFARRSHRDHERHFDKVFALAIAIASTGMFFRVLLMAFLLNPPMGAALLVPMLVGAGVIGAGAVWLALQVQREQEMPVEPDNGDSKREVRSPFALRPALQFGAMFAAVLLLSKAAQVYYGDTGTYVSSVIGGIPGLDAVTLSMAKLANNSLSEVIAMRSVALGAASNTLFKGVIAMWLGHGAVRSQILPLFTLAALASLGAAFLMVG